MGATVLLLAALASQLSGIVTTAEVGRFDFKLCEERLCLTNQGCNVFGKKNLNTHQSDAPCKIVLAIWQYSAKKWRITIQTDLATNEIVLGIVDQSSILKTKVLSCAKSDGKVVVNPGISAYTTEIISGVTTAEYFKCELFLETSRDRILPEGMGDFIGLKYDADSENTLLMGMQEFEAAISRYPDMCNPDRIKFDADLGKKGQKLLPVVTDENSIVCPQSYDLMYAADSDAKKVTSIRCMLKDIGNVRSYSYQITGISEGAILTMPTTQDFKAHCARSVCKLCTSVECETTPSTICPEFTKPIATDENSCAEMKCSGDRFSLPDGTTVVGVAECEEGGWTIGEKHNITAATCAQFVSCQTMTPLTCADKSCEIKGNDVVGCKEKGATLSANQCQVSSLHCNNQTGEWSVIYLNGTKGPLRGSTNVTCVVGASPLKGSSWIRPALAIAVVATYFAIGCTMCCIGNMKYGLGETEDPRITPQLEEFYRREMEKEEKAKAKEETKKTSKERTTGSAHSDPPTTTTKRKESKGEGSVESANSGRTEPTQQVSQPPLRAITAPQAMTPAAPRHDPAAAAVQPTSAEHAHDNQYEPIPGLEVPAVEVDPSPRPSAEAVTHAPPHHPPSSADDQYEEIAGLNGEAPPPPPPAPATAKTPAEEQYVMIDPKSRAPPPPPSVQQLLQQSQLQPVQPSVDETPPRASQYYANSKLK